MLDGRAQPTGIRQRGQDATLLMVFNAWHDLVGFKLPPTTDQRWKLIIDTNLAEEEEEKEDQHFTPEQVYDVTGRCFLLFELIPDVAG